MGQEVSLPRSLMVLIVIMPPQTPKLFQQPQDKPRTLVQNNGEFMGLVQEIHEFFITKEMIRSYSNYNFYYLIEGDLPMGLTWCRQHYSHRWQPCYNSQTQANNEFSFPHVIIRIALSFYVGVEFIKYQDNQLFVAQQNDAIKCIEELGFSDCNLGSVPLLDGTHLEIDMNQPFVDAT